MQFQNEYSNKLISAQDAAKLVKSGDWVDYSFCVNHPYDFDKALAERMNKEPDLKDVNIRGSIALWQPEITKIDHVADRITWNSWHFSGLERKLTDQGFVFYNPLKFSELPMYYRDNIKHVNVACLQTAPMDPYGYFNFGLSAAHLQALIEVSDIVIVEVNKNMPQALGGFGHHVHISNVNYIIEGSNPPVAQLKSAQPSEIDQKVAELILPEIHNGDCLQLGIGGMPNAVGMMIAESDLKDLGVHTEMYVDAFMKLTQKGKINGIKKNIDYGRQVYSFAAGSTELYEFIDNNPELMSTSVDYSNDVRVISQIDNFVSINNAVEVDLFCQVASESAGTRHISGAGGQLDFVMGAYLAKGGRSFVCLSSTVTSKDGSLKSRIKPTLPVGSIVTATRANAHNIVTEYGIANVKGTSTWQRAEMIIGIAHPQFRDELIKDAENMGIWRRSNKR